MEVGLKNDVRSINKKYGFKLHSLDSSQVWLIFERSAELFEFSVVNDMLVCVLDYGTYS